jgi:hypothetical protein
MVSWGTVPGQTKPPLSKQATEKHKHSPPGKERRGSREFMIYSYYSELFCHSRGSGNPF